MITQDELAHYRVLKRQADEIEKALKEARDSFLARQGQGVEPGPLGIRVDARTSRSFSYEAIVDLMGRKMADLIKGVLPEKSSQVLTVTAA